MTEPEDPWLEPTLRHTRTYVRPYKLWVVVLTVFVTVLLTELLWLFAEPYVADWLQIGETAWSPETFPA